MYQVIHCRHFDDGNITRAALAMLQRGATKTKVVARTVAAFANLHSILRRGSKGSAFVCSAFLLEAFPHSSLSPLGVMFLFSSSLKLFLN